MNSANSDLDFLFESDKKLNIKILDINKDENLNPMNDLMESQATYQPATSARQTNSEMAVPDLTPVRLRKPSDSQ